MDDKHWASSSVSRPLVASDGCGDELQYYDVSDRTAFSSRIATKASGTISTDHPIPPKSTSMKGISCPSRENSTKHTVKPSSPWNSDMLSSQFSGQRSPSSPRQHTSQHQRRSSLTARYPGDQSHRPLDVIRAEQRVADRPRRGARVGADTIDQLDLIGASGIPYHHDGPYDATLLARNLSFASSPIAATRQSNEEAIKATPQEFVNDSIERHRPLWGTATIPPGVEDPFGRVLHYEEGPNLNIEMGWRRWEGLEYHPEDIKGKGEPMFTLERVLKNHKSHRRIVSEGNIELREKANSVASKALFDDQGRASGFCDKSIEINGIRRAHTTGKRSSAVASVLRNRFGSLRKKRHEGDEIAQTH